MILNHFAKNLKAIILPITVVLAVHFISFFAFGLHRAFRSAPKYFHGLAYAPFGAEDNPLAEQYPSLDQIEMDLEILGDHTDSIRLYSSVGVSRKIPQLAKFHEMSVTAGAWLDADSATNEQELEALLLNARENANIEKVVAGNEVILRGDMAVEDLVKILQRVRPKVDQPVGTAETWKVWLENPELAENVDFLMVHILPYWEGVPVKAALDYFFMRFEELQECYPDKPIILGEVGWPSDGQAYEGAKPGQEAQRYFLSHFVSRAEDKGLDYFIMEAFDQPWKVELEGEVGAHWGIFDAQRQWKLEPDSILPFLPVAFWSWLIASFLGLTATVAMLGLRPKIRSVGLCAFVLILQMALLALAAAAGQLPPWPLDRLIVYGPLLIALTGVLSLAIYSAWETTELLWRTSWVKCGQSIPTFDNRPEPRVSIHVPICSEPPAQVIASLDALAKLEYSNYEVLVISNNTKDEEKWRHVQEWCQRQGEPFNFFHVEQLEGYKAGALNYALDRTDPGTSIIGVIDSDYIVSRNWLKRTIPYFNQESVAIVQAPQDHRDKKPLDLFSRMCNWEYRGFFRLGMVQRNERNAIITHGTMVLLRRSAVEEAGRWAEWCICEDAELGLRLMEHGYKAVYVPDILGQGILPNDFSAYKSQRSRWAYGAVRIMCRHASALFLGRRTRLTPMQRLHFIAGWLPWFGDAMHLLFTVTMMLWSLAMLFRPDIFAAPATVLLLPVLFVSGFLFMRSWVLYSARVPCGFADRLAATIAGLALVPTIGVSVLHGLVTSSRPFLRTRKFLSQTSLLGALESVVMEFFLFLFLLAFLTAMLIISPTEGFAFRLWCLLLALQMTPYLGAIAMALASTSTKQGEG